MAGRVNTRPAFFLIGTLDQTPAVKNHRALQPLVEGGKALWFFKERIQSRLTIASLPY
jgi:hypothetical protein